jgi:hypothetical protein
VKCPICGRVDTEECAEEVDIGVGVQRHIWGYVCATCGELPVCSHCGAVGDDAKDHFMWCDREVRK